MSQPVLLKVYANFTPAGEADCRELEEICSQAIAAEDDHDPFVTMLGDMVRLSFEGLYFPVEDVEPVVERLALAGATGKMDVLDLENWRMTRYQARDGQLKKSSAPLNNVLDYSGH
ncbi:MAG: hypothetical protein Q4F72_08820 [Desulfovibrionaceae bacterium]|nr:hypothetical protein [Desulfovibrionaceae bacterium]